jgi:periplasmic divalent cation tolerance protein
MNNFIQVVTATEKKEQAEHIAKAIIDQRLAGCAQILGPITSIYHWKGKVERAEEWLCVLKTRADRFGQLEQAIKSLHPYETPEILAFPVSAGSASYLDWLTGELNEART